MEQKPTLNSLRIDQNDVEDSPNVLVEAVAAVRYETEELGSGVQVIRSHGQIIPYDSIERIFDETYDSECDELKKILALFGIDVSEFDEMRRRMIYV